MVGNSPVKLPIAADGCGAAPIRAPGEASPADRLTLLKAAADPTRLAVLDTLARCGSRCHCDLEVELDIPANRLSFHLKVLRDAGLVVSRRRGQRVDYHLREGAIQSLHAALPSSADQRTDVAPATTSTSTSAVRP